MSTDYFFLPIQEDIRLVEERMRALSDGYHPDLGAALNHLLASGGKRVRPAVALLTGRMMGADRQKSVTLAAAIELLHTATLVHDDLIDGALLRRGIPTLNAKWSAAATILTGDFIFACAATLAAETTSVEVMHLFAKTLTTIVNGEVTQLFSSGDLVSRESYYKRIYAKTASLFETATSSAALISPMGREWVEAARRFGYEIGMAFQIVDDVLDFTGEQVAIGKPVGSDLRQGLITLPTLCYMEAHPEDEDVKALLTDKSREESQLTRLIARIADSEAIGDSLSEARQFIEHGLQALSGFPAGAERQSLEELASYVLRRQK